MKAVQTAIGVIPARYQSSRLPGKPLVMIGDKPMIQHVCERAIQAESLSEVWVATDDERILNTVQKFGGRAVMTSPTCVSGTDRVAEAAQNMEADIVVNIQGDEPFIHPKEIDLAAQILMTDPEAVVGTLMKRIFHTEDLISRNTAKVVVNEQGYALYFSRQPIPFYRDIEEPGEWLKMHAYYKHIGIYSYRKDFLHEMTRWPPTSLEKSEKLEQLRVLERGGRIKVAETDSESICVDTPDDLERAQKLYASDKHA